MLDRERIVGVDSDGLQTPEKFDVKTVVFGTLTGISEVSGSNDSGTRGTSMLIMCSHTSLATACYIGIVIILLRARVMGKW